MDTSVLVQHLASVVTLSFCTYFYCSVLNPRWTKLVAFVIVLAGYVFLVWPLDVAFLNDYPVQRIITNAILEISYMCVAFRDKLWRIILMKVLSLIVLVLGDLFGLIASELLFHQPALNLFGLNWETLAIYVFLYYPITILLFVYGAKLINSMSKKYSGISVSKLLCIGFFPLSQMVVLVYLVIMVAYFLNGTISGMYLVALAGAIILCILADILLIYIIRDTGKKAKLEAEYSYLRKQQEMQLEHYQAFVEHQGETRRLRHDIVNHVQTIKALIDSDEKEEARDYTDKLSHRFDKIISIDFCNHKVIDAVLHNKVKYAESLGVKSLVKVAVDSDIPIDDLDLMTVFSNLLDNAIDAAAKSPGERYFSVTTTTEAGFLVVKVENTGDGSDIWENQKLRTGRGHGLGLGIVESVTEKYDGSFIVKQDGNNYQAIAMVRCEKI